MLHVIGIPICAVIFCANIFCAVIKRTVINCAVITGAGTARRPAGKGFLGQTP